MALVTLKVFEKSTKMKAVFQKLIVELTFSDLHFRFIDHCITFAYSTQFMHYTTLFFEIGFCSPFGEIFFLKIKMKVYERGYFFKAM